jgi:predicted transcriptional regulator
MKQNPRYNVISMRISDDEKEMLQKIMRTRRKSLSDLMREALSSLEHRDALYPNRRDLDVF